ncbi:hypothetical protein PAPHI01_1784 [Pancytospora philotis]|nr:hypothetical protein PAPHI01_1784 [Pancytospora philotis]
MVLAQIFQVLVVCSCYAEAAINPANVAVSDLRSFGAPDRHTLTILESQILDSLFERCWRLECCKIARKRIDRLQSTTEASDKARHIILCVITDANPAVQLLQLLNSVGFGGHFLLLKLFTKDYVGSLKMDTLTRFREFFATRAARDEVLCAYPRQLLRETVDNVLNLDIRDYDKTHGAANSCIDYMLFEMKKGLPLFTKSELQDLWRLLGYWLEDAVRFAPRRSVASDLIRFVMQSNLLKDRMKLDWKSSIVKKIVDNGSQDYISLLSALDSTKTATAEVKALVESLGYDKHIAGLIWNFTDHIENGNAYKYPGDVISALHGKYFPPTFEAFYKTPTPWNQDPRFFSKISPRLLYVYFTELYYAKNRLKTRDRNMRECMRMLSCDACAEFLKFVWLRDEEGSAILLGFMLRYLDEDYTREYLARARSRLAVKISDPHLDLAYRKIFNKIIGVYVA